MKWCDFLPMSEFVLQLPSSASQAGIGEIREVVFIKMLYENTLTCRHLPTPMNVQQATPETETCFMSDTIGRGTSDKKSQKSGQKTRKDSSQSIRKCEAPPDQTSTRSNHKTRRMYLKVLAVCLIRCWTAHQPQMYGARLRNISSRLAICACH